MAEIYNYNKYMPRKRTVVLSLVVIPVILAVLVATAQFGVELHWAIEKPLVLCVFFSILRLNILWVQTLIHSIQNTRANTVAWVVGHLFTGALVSCLYYFRHKEPALK